MRVQEASEEKEKETFKLAEGQSFPDAVLEMIFEFKAQPPIANRICVTTRLEHTLSQLELAWFKDIEKPITHSQHIAFQNFKNHTLGLIPLPLSTHVIHAHQITLVLQHLINHPEALDAVHESFTTYNAVTGNPLHPLVKQHKLWPLFPNIRDTTFTKVRPVDAETECKRHSSNGSKHMAFAYLQLNNCRFEDCSLHNVSFSHTTFNRVTFDNKCFLFAVDFSECDITNIHFDSDCIIRCYDGHDSSVIKPFRLTNTIMSAQQMLLFIRHGVLDIDDINWDIQPDEVKTNRKQLTALNAVMQATLHTELKHNNTPFEVEAISRSYIARTFRHFDTRPQSLVRDCQIQLVSTRKGYTRINVDLPFIQHHAIADVVYTLEQMRHEIDKEREYHYSSERNMLKGIGYHHRILDDQHITVNLIQQCQFNHCSLSKLHYKYAHTTFEDCTYSATTIHQPKIHKLGTLKFSHCQFNDGTTLEPKEGSGYKLQFTQSHFYAARLTGNFNSCKFNVDICDNHLTHRCTFTHTELEGSFCSANFNGAQINRCKLIGEFDSAEFNQAIFNHCEIEGDFTNAEFDEVVFNQCDLSHMTYSSGAFQNASLFNCRVDTHEQIILLMVNGEADIRQLDWEGMGRDLAPYMALYALYQIAKSEPVNQLNQFAGLLCDATRHIVSLDRIERALNTEGAAKHSRFFGWRSPESNHYHHLQRDFQVHRAVM